MFVDVVDDEQLGRDQELVAHNALVRAGHEVHALDDDVPALGERVFDAGLDRAQDRGALPQERVDRHPVAQPVAVTAGTPYVVSYHTDTGHYSATGSAFANGGVTNGPLTALADGAAGSNGLFLYGSGGFQTGSVGSGNYWVDVVYTPG